MKMVEAKKEIEDKLFVGAPLSFETMVCALIAINAFIEHHGETSSISLELNVPEEDQEAIRKKATDKLMCELQSGAGYNGLDGYLSSE